MLLAKNNLTGRRAGFSLIELLVVVIIIGILAGIGVPGYAVAMDRARGAKMIGNMKVVQLALENFAADSKGSYPYYADTAPTTNSDVAMSVVMTPNFVGYLPGGQFPPSPWSNPPMRQSLMGGPFVAGGASENLVSSAAVISAGTAGLTASGKILGIGHAPLDPIDECDQSAYGALIYGCDPNSQTYVLYGSGKNLRSSVVVCSATNNGGK